MNPATLDDRPELTVEAGGRAYRFSELPIGKLMDLQEYINRAVPHPVDAIKPRLDGLPPDERLKMLEAARAEGRDWPPRVGTSRGVDALSSSLMGLVETLHAGLGLHHPDLTRDDALALYYALARRNDGDVGRIISVLFGNGDPGHREPMDLPEGSAPGRAGSTGGSSIAPATNGSS